MINPKFRRRRRRVDEGVLALERKEKKRESVKGIRNGWPGWVGGG